jgi:hypothetical protein
LAIGISLKDYRAESVIHLSQEPKFRRFSGIFETVPLPLAVFPFKVKDSSTHGDYMSYTEQATEESPSGVKLPRNSMDIDFDPELDPEKIPYEHNLHDTLKTIAGISGNVLEWYDFAIFGFFGDISKYSISN